MTSFEKPIVPENTEPPVRICVMANYNSFDARIGDRIRKATHVGYMPHEVQGPNNEKMIRIGQGKEWAVISDMDTYDKYSEGFRNCIGALITATRLDGVRESMMIHVRPDTALEKYRDEFRKALIDKLLELKSRKGNTRFDPTSFECNVFAGNYFKGIYRDRVAHKSYADTYVETIDFLRDTIESALSLQMHVLQGPNIFEKPNHIFYETPTKRLYSIRPEQPSVVNEPYVAGNVAQRRRYWDKHASD